MSGTSLPPSFFVLHKAHSFDRHLHFWKQGWKYLFYQLAKKNSMFLDFNENGELWGYSCNCFFFLSFLPVLDFFQWTDLLNWFWKYFYVSESPFGTGALSVGNVHYNSTFRLCLCGTNAWWWWVHLHWMCRWARTICICNCGLVVCKVGRGLIIVSVVISAVFAYLDVCSLGITSCKQHTAQSPYSLLRGEFS